MAYIKPLKEYTLLQLANLRLYGNPEGRPVGLPLSIRDSYRDVVNAHISTLPEDQRTEFDGIIRRALDNVPEPDAVNPGSDTSLTGRLMAKD